MAADGATLSEVIAALHRSQRLLVTAHPNPDGDAIGSMAAAAIMMRAMGREVVAYNPDPVPGRYAFLSGTEAFVRDIPPISFDTTLLLDCSDERLFCDHPLPLSRLGTLVVIDHHRTSGTIGDLVYRDPSAAAVGVLLYRVFSAMGLDVTPAAEPLFCSIMSDTGSFRYQNTNAEAMDVAGALLQLGVDPWRVASRLYENRPKKEVLLLGHVLSTLEVSPDGCCASLTVNESLLDALDCTPDMLDGMINFARSIEGVEVAALFRQRAGATRVSLRSRGALDVSAIAVAFDGGGHRNAAGFTSKAPLAEIRAAIHARTLAMLLTDDKAG